MSKFTHVYSRHELTHACVFLGGDEQKHMEE